MKRHLAVIAAVLALCCTVLVGTVSRSRAEGCTTQGALALALADVLGINVTSAQAAADALAALGIKPTLGWDVAACLTDAVALEIRQSFAAPIRDIKDFDRAMGLIGRIPDQQYQGKINPMVSPFKP